MKVWGVRTYMLDNEDVPYRTMDGEVSKLKNIPLARCRHKTELDVDVDIEHIHVVKPDHGVCITNP